MKIYAVNEADIDPIFSIALWCHPAVINDVAAFRCHALAADTIETQAAQSLLGNGR